MDNMIYSEKIKEVICFYFGDEEFYWITFLNGSSKLKEEIEIMKERMKIQKKKRKENGLNEYLN